MLELSIKTNFSKTSNEATLLKQWRFPCGEAGVKLSEETLARLRYASDVSISLVFESNDDLFALAQLVDVIRANRFDQIPISLSIPYFPYSRQDRRCSPGEGHALKVVASFINSLHFWSVITYDAHSAVLEGLVNNLINLPQEQCAAALPAFEVLIAPDAGAEKKVYKHLPNQAKLGAKPFVLTASKERDENGKIIRATLPYGFQVADVDVCVVDDLCDGGATFLELGKIIKSFSPRSMSLYVTHGMFTNSEKFVELHDLYDRIFVCNMSPTAEAKFGNYVEKI